MQNLHFPGPGRRHDRTGGTLGPWRKDEGRKCRAVGLRKERRPEKQGSDRRRTDWRIEKSNLASQFFKRENTKDRRRNFRRGTRSHSQRGVVFAENSQGASLPGWAFGVEKGTGKMKAPNTERFKGK